MPRLNTAAPRYRKQKRPNGTDLAFVELDGKRVYLGPFGSQTSRVQYDQIVARWLAAGRDVDRATSALTVTELLARWLYWAKTHYRRPDGESTGKLASLLPAMRTLRHLYGNTRVDDFGPKSLKALRQFVVEHGTVRKSSENEKAEIRTGGPTSRQYANAVAAHVRAVFRWGVSEELVRPETWHGLQAVRNLQAGRCAARESDPIEPVEDAIVEATLPHLSPVVADMVRLQQLTGMRPGEVCQLRPRDIDRSQAVWSFRPARHKTQHKQKSRTVFIGPRGQEVLQPYLNREADEYCFSPRDTMEQHRAAKHAARKTSMSCGNKPGSNVVRAPKRTARSAYTSDTYRRAIHRACDHAFPPTETLEGDAIREWQSSKRWSPNQIRHSVATKVRKKYGLEAAQVILGHSSANVTQVYAERDMARAAEVMQELG